MPAGPGAVHDAHFAVSFVIALWLANNGLRVRLRGLFGVRAAEKKRQR